MKPNISTNDMQPGFSSNPIFLSTFPFYQKGMYKLFMLLLEKEWKYPKTPICILSSAKSPAQNVNYKIRVCTEKTWLKQLFKDQDIILLSL